MDTIRNLINAVLVLAPPIFVIVVMWRIFRNRPPCSANIVHGMQEIDERRIS